MSSELQEALERLKLQEESEALGQAGARAAGEKPLIDIREEDVEQLLEQLLDPDVESTSYPELEEYLQPLLSQTQMLAGHGRDYYTDIARELINEALAERIILQRKRGSLLTGPFLEVALEVEGEFLDDVPPWTEMQKEMARVTVRDVRTDRQSLGDGSLLDALTKIHTSAEVNRGDGTGASGGGGIIAGIKRSLGR